MLINLRNALMAGKRLPYDAEVEYLESTGTQYIDTGIVAKPQTIADVTFRWIGTPATDAILLGARNNNVSAPRFIMLMTNQTKIRQLGVGTGWANWGYYTMDTDYNSVSTFVSGSTSQSIDGSTIITSSNALVDIGRTLYLFASNDATNLYPATARVYQCRLYQDGVLVRDYIPVRKGTVGYLYDRVSGKLFGNAGTGDFVVGPDVVPVEWLQGDGSAYIVLPQSITSSKTTALSIECKYIADVSAINKCVFASYYGSRWYAIGRIQYNAAPVIIARFGNYGQYMRTTDLNGVYTTKIIPSQDKVIENGVEYSETFTAGLNQAVDAIGLFCAYNTNDKSIMAVNSSRLYWFNVLSVDGGSIVKNLIPIRVGSGSTWEGALLDTVTRRIYRNAGTGAFGYGNDLKYPIPAS